MKRARFHVLAAWRVAGTWRNTTVAVKKIFVELNEVVVRQFHQEASLMR